MNVERSTWNVAGASGDVAVSPTDLGDDSAVAVGDWLIIDRSAPRAKRRLERKTLFKRRAPGTDRSEQVIAANVDTLFIVSSCNQDFNEARLERYLSIAHDAGVMPVVVLTKSDLADDPGDYAARASKLAPGLLVETVNALDRDSVEPLGPWLQAGQTIALLGSSGVGKSTLTNTLLGEARLATQSIREDDDKGRHTTTSRQMFSLPGGAWLIDTPGMRELQLVDVSEGIDDVFAEIAPARRAVPVRRLQPRRRARVCRQVGHRRRDRRPGAAGALAQAPARRGHESRVGRRAPGPRQGDRTTIQIDTQRQPRPEGAELIIRPGVRARRQALPLPCRPGYRCAAPTVAPRAGIGTTRPCREWFLRRAGF